jgi:hypothetical protein
MVLRHLSERAASEKDAQTLVKSNLVQSDLLVELLNSPDEATSNGARWIIVQLIVHNPTALKIRGINSWELPLTRKERLTANEGRAEKARSDAIDRRIREDRKRFQKEHKILVLGTSQSGKSTIVKQMKIVYQGGLDVRERAEYRTTIYKDVLDWAGTLARVVERVGVDSLPEKVWEHAEILLMAFSAPSEDDDVDVGADPVPFTRMGGDSEYHGGMSLGRVGSMRHETSHVLAQTHAVLSPALADAVWHIWRALAVDRVVDEHPTELYPMDSAE